MAKRSNRELEELKRKQEEEAAAEVFQEFVATFEESTSSKAGLNKVWVKAGTYDAGQRKEDTKDKGKLYKPTSKLAELAETFSTRQPKVEDSKEKEKLAKKKTEREKRKSNLEAFKEELRAIQEEREERHRLKASLAASGLAPLPTKSSRFEGSSPTSVKPASLLDETKGSFDPGDPTTTNIYLGNINPKMTEQALLDIFGKYGPIGSIKIMYPRSEEEKARGRHCGFVAFMNRKDAQRAMQRLNGRELMGFEQKLGWGKAIPIPPRPVYVPPKLLELTMPPPPSGLPFNAQPTQEDAEQVPPPGTPYPTKGPGLDLFHQIISRAIVKVVIPTDRNLLCLIHRTVEFVVREGPMFEAMLMNKEIENPAFRFLFDNRSPAHTYYRWKLYSVLQGETTSNWRSEEFRMFEGGSIWKPPLVNPYAQGMPEELISDDESPEFDKRKTLSKSQSKRFESMLRHLTPERTKVQDAMIFCIEHAEAAEEIIEFISESLSSSKTSLAKKLARLYLISDIMYNCTAKVTNVSYYRKGFQSQLEVLMEYLHTSYAAIEGRLKAEAFKQRVLQVFRAWEDWALFPQDYLIHLQNVFLGLVREDDKQSKHEEDPDVDGVPLEDPDLDGAPLSDEDLDGVPLDGAALLRTAQGVAASNTVVSPPRARREASPAARRQSSSNGRQASSLEQATGFRPSIWETVDPAKVEAQAVTTSKWESLEEEQHKRRSDYDDEDLDGQPIQRDESSQDTANYSQASTESDRLLLREVEVRVMQYQDELESNPKVLRGKHSISEEVQRYREKLLRRAEQGQDLHFDQDDDRERHRDRRGRDKRSRRDSSSSEDRRHRRRSPSTTSTSESSSQSVSRSRSRSRTPKRSRRHKSSGRSEDDGRSRSPSSRRSKRSRTRSRSRSPKRHRKSKKSRH